MSGAHLVLLSDKTTFVVSIIVAILSAVLALYSWNRTGRRTRVLVLECLRVVIVALVLFAINEPEWVRPEPPKKKPTLAVFWDDSDSMRTKDVIVEGGPTSRPISRLDRIRSRIAPEVWKPLEAKFDVKIQPFSSRAADPEDDQANPNNDRGGVSTNLVAPLAETLDRDPTLRAAVVFSDGDWNAGSAPVDVAMRYRAKDVPIFTAAVGSPTALPDISVVAVDAPKFAILGKPVQVPFTLRSSMPRDIDCTVTVEVDDGETVTEEIHLRAKSLFEGEFHWTPRRPGTAKVKLNVPVAEGEFDIENNRRDLSIEVRDESIKVLLIDSYPRWEYRYLRNALVRDEAVDVACLLFHPDLEKRGGGPRYIKSFPSKRELSEFDVVFLGDVGVAKNMLKSEDCELLKGLVEQQASGLILMPGLRGHQASLAATPLADLFPVELDASRPKGIGSAAVARFSLTEDGRGSPLTKLSGDPAENARIWEAFPGFNWHAGALRARPGAKTLVVHRDGANEYGRYPLLAIRPYGAGKVLFMGTDTVWKWREGVEDKYHYRFWAQVSRWMSYQRKMAAGRTMRLFYSPDRPETGSKVLLNANVMDAAGEPMEDATVSAVVTAPSKSRQVVRLSREKDGEWGLFKGAFEPKEPGIFNVQLLCKETGEAVETLIEVYGRAVEQRGLPARPDVLDELSRVSRGARIENERIEDVLTKLERLPPAPPDTIRIRIWAEPLWGSVLVLLMGLFWIGRKMIGRF